jgi:hypothetical protein
MRIAPQIKAILNRWFSILAYAVFGLVGIPLGLAYASLGRTLFSKLSPELPWAGTALYWVCTGSVLCVLLRQTKFRLSHLRYLFRYPPTLVSVLITWAIVLGVLATSPSLLAITELEGRVLRLACLATLGIVIAIILLSLAQSLHSRRPLTISRPRRTPLTLDQLTSAAPEN